MELIPFIVAFWLMFRGFTLCGYSTDLKRYGTKDWGWYLVFGILAILCSMAIIWQPGLGAVTVLYMLSITFLIIGCFRVIFSFELKRLHKKQVKKIVYFGLRHTLFVFLLAQNKQ